ncbi:MAG: transcription-repair coupling factor [Actinomycetota bacterium]|nr:transcription-repair coupling factor [Actinomycetota bacterium]
MLKAFKESQSYKDLMLRISKGEDCEALAPSNIYSLPLSALLHGLKRPIVMIVRDEIEVERVAVELKNFLDPALVATFPDLEVLPFERAEPDPEVVANRLKALGSLSRNEGVIVLSSLKAALFDISYIIPARLGALTAEVGREVDLYEFSASLCGLGYERRPKVEGRGELSVRGGIVDIFPPDMPEPIRLEFYSDMIESIRSFDLASQRSIDELKSVAIYPCSEFIIDEDLEKITERLKSLREQPAWLKEDIARLESGTSFPGASAYGRLLAERPRCLTGFMPKGSLLILGDREILAAKAKVLSSKADDFTQGELGRLITALTGHPPFLSFDVLLEGVKGTLSLSPGLGHRGAIEFSSKRIDPLLGDMDKFKDFLMSEDGLKVIVLRSRGQLERMAEIIAGFGLEYSREFSSLSSRLPLLIEADFGEGFGLTDPKLRLICESDIFVKVRPLRRDKQTATCESPITLAEMEAGDKVVHRNQGIGIFVGLTRKEALGIRREYILLEYKDGDRLYVPLEQIGLISKYIGAEGEGASLSKLGMKDWARAKAKVKRSVKKLAFDLLSLHAYRMEVFGHSFSKDSPWQAEMEETFPFAETADQIGAIGDVKIDMEKGRPMDRLVCGDVGYGKTEVALRAAFKAALDGKQVLVLVPTTILANQHFLTFKERFAPYPVRIELLSRFRKRDDEKRVLLELEAGLVDVVIGTHRLLQKDVVFKDLGLVIIDEEQRFGVANKEHFKNLRKNVDVLTMSATPIPRTLQMSLSGVRDLSVINTPPEDRFPIATKVVPYDEELIRSAVRRELSRGGQIFYVHNRVMTINAAAERLRGLIPEAKIAIAHGQMDERELEKVMDSFLKGEQDILLCTTIIESGIDIPRANTIIVEMAERLGLAQMYQLRGRVGRSHHLAYAYFLSSGELACEDAQKRLKAMADFTELGSGIKIALRDLEIRGAGSILGAEQHGQMEAVGFELYNQLLKEAVLELKGEELPKDASTLSIDLPIEAIIPADYIEDEGLRIDAYRSIALAMRREDLPKVEAALRDRFGRFGEPVRNLLDLAEIRLLAMEASLDGLSYDGRRLKLAGVELGRDGVKALSGLGGSGPKLDYRPASKTLFFTIGRLDGTELLSFVKKLLDDIIKNRK